MSLTKMLKVAGYDDFIFYFSKDKYANKSSKELIEKYRDFETDLLRFDAKKEIKQEK